MNNRSLHTAWPLLRRQVKGLHMPWLEKDVRRHSKRDPFRVLISCLLSLRTQDKTTGGATERLFSLANNPERMSKLSLRRIEDAIYPVGFYRVKAGRVREICRVLVKDHHSKVPDTMEGLMRLKGVGRKTANLVLTLGFGKPGICVDTHVHRITNRWGYIETTSPEKTEMALRGRLPSQYWLEINGLLVSFGQGICRPVSPLCSRCLISRFCNRVGVGISR
jgi:endonuclease-3